MAQISYIKGDLFDAIPADTGGHTIIIPHVVNDVGKMASGFVVPLCKRWHVVKESYEQWFKGEFGIEFELGIAQIITVQDNDGLIYVANMVAQHETHATVDKPIRYLALAKCMDGVRKHALSHAKPVIHCPMFGSDRARGNWQFIEELIRELWTAYDIPVNIYYLHPKQVDFLHGKS